MKWTKKDDEATRKLFEKHANNDPNFWGLYDADTGKRL